MTASRTASIAWFSAVLYDGTADSFNRAFSAVHDMTAAGFFEQNEGWKRFSAGFGTESIINGKFLKIFVRSNKNNDTKRIKCDILDTVSIIEGCKEGSSW
ncbi:hypothetical protein PAECIP111893_03337 [Paenibacillus plantiphilus]|uniref:Uncharacterized protein n=1 Tax=Paenibacillus plantiphilus TaxID=2905650 RepID=A0ABN8GLX9_9BACL|nr:hypothetical protein PAECIP111893_03337 [Paenibacillus plantiphilus]